MGKIVARRAHSASIPAFFPVSWKNSGSSFLPSASLAVHIPVDSSDICVVCTRHQHIWSRADGNARVAAPLSTARWRKGSDSHQQQRHEDKPYRLRCTHPTPAQLRDAASVYRCCSVRLRFPSRVPIVPTPVSVWFRSDLARGDSQDCWRRDGMAPAWLPRALACRLASLGLARRSPRSRGVVRRPASGPTLVPPASCAHACLVGGPESGLGRSGAVDRYVPECLCSENAGSCRNFPIDLL